MVDWGWWRGRTMGEAVASAVQRYAHRSPTLAADVERGARIALMGLPDWDPAAWRAWLVRSASLQAQLSGTVATAAGGAMSAEIVTGLGWRSDVAATLARTAEIVAELSAEPGDRVPANPSTSSGGAGDTGAWPVAVIAVLVVGGVAAIGWCGYQASQVIDRQLARSAATRELVRTDEIVQRLLDAHLARERAAGRELPLDAATQAALDNLHERQLLAAPHAPPLPSPSGGADPFGLSTLLPLAAAAVVAIFILPPLLQKV